MKRFIVFCLTMATVFSAMAWGPKGHDTVAYIAEKHLSKKTLQKVLEVLDGHSLVYVANWMDNASHTDEYAYTKTWHYVNVDPSEGSYANSVKAASGDAVTAINTLVDNLKSGELTAEEERVQLMMLIHIVGDIQKKLHSVWDSEIVESAHRWSYSEWQDQIDRATPKQQQAYMQSTPNDWIEETVALANECYESAAKAGNMSYDYVAEYAPVIEQQFLKGGIRLAKLIEEIY